MISKAELSDKILQLLIKEMPLDDLTSGTDDSAREYFDVLTDAMTAVTARMAVAYIGRAVASNPTMTEDELMELSSMIHVRLASHMDFEATDLMKKLEQTNRMDA
jgi:hypothetical protein